MKKVAVGELVKASRALAISVARLFEEPAALVRRRGRPNRLTND